MSASGYFEHWRRKDADKPSRPGATTSASAMKPCWFTSRPSARRSSRNTAGQRCGNSCSREGIRVGKERVRKADATPRHQGQGQEKVCRHHRQQARVAHCAESVGTRLLASGAERSVQQRQYCSHEFQKALAGYEMKSSMSRKGHCWDTQSNITLSVAVGLTRAGIGFMPSR